MTLPDLLVATLAHNTGTAVVKLPCSVPNPGSRGGGLLWTHPILPGRYTVQHTWLPLDAVSGSLSLSFCARDGQATGQLTITSVLMMRGVATPDVFMRGITLRLFSETAALAWILAVLPHLELCEDADALCDVYGVSADAALAALVKTYPFLNDAVVGVLRTLADPPPWDPLLPGVHPIIAPSPGTNQSQKLNAALAQRSKPHGAPLHGEDPTRKVNPALVAWLGARGYTPKHWPYDVHWVLREEADRAFGGGFILGEDGYPGPCLLPFDPIYLGA